MSRVRQPRSASHPASRGESKASTPIVSSGEDLILPEGQVGEEAAEMLQDFLRPGHRQDETLVDLDEGDLADEEERKALPWWKRPSPYWLLCMVPFSAIATGACMAPRIEIYTLLACVQHKPEYTTNLDLRYLGIPFHPWADTPILPPPPSRLDMLLARNSSASPGDISLCAKDPEVQAAVAELSTAIAVTLGILTCFTVAFWGALSDRYGRVRVLSISVIGLLLTDANFIVVAKASTRLPGGYWLLLIGPVVEGCLGGLAGVIAVLHAYIADTSLPSVRSRMFSLSTGLLFVGMALGPTVGALLIRVTHNTLSVFYLAICTHTLYALIVWFILPESRSTRLQQGSRKAREDETRRAREGTNPAVKRLLWHGGLFTFLSPLSVLAPAQVEDSASNPLKKRRRDWSLAFAVVAYGCTISLIGGATYKFQYASYEFGWTSQELGYWLSLAGATRAIYLTVILPTILKLLSYMKPEPAVQLNTTPDEPLHGDASTPGSPPKPERHSPSADLMLARLSLCMEFIGYTLFWTLPPSPAFFVGITIFVSLGAGFGPAVQSVALSLFTVRPDGRDTGKLFGAISVVQAISASILGPSVFGFTYIHTVAVFPRAIFALSSALVAFSFIALLFVRTPKNPQPQNPEEPAHRGREETLVDIGEGTSADPSASSKPTTTTSMSAQS